MLRVDTVKQSLIDSATVFMLTYGIESISRGLGTVYNLPTVVFVNEPKH